MLVAVTVITQPRNVTGCVGGSAMFTCMMEFQNVSIRRKDIKWWRKRTDVAPDTHLLLRENLRLCVTTNISEGILISVLMMTELKPSFVGPYWLGMANDTQLSDMAFLNIIPHGMYAISYICSHSLSIMCILCGFRDFPPWLPRILSCYIINSVL